jgi:hypothetical protein
VNILVTFIKESVPAALTKDKKRIRNTELSVHLAWKSTLYVTNFPASMDDLGIKKLFGKVCIEPFNQVIFDNCSY